MGQYKFISIFPFVIGKPSASLEQESINFLSLKALKFLKTLIPILTITAAEFVFNNADSVWMIRDSVLHFKKM